MDKTDEDEDESEDGDGGLFGSGSDDDEEEEAMGVEAEIDPVEMEQRKRIKLLAEEMGDLDKAIASKETELKKSANPIFKVRTVTSLPVCLWTDSLEGFASTRNVSRK